MRVSHLKHYSKRNCLSGKKSIRDINCFSRIHEATKTVVIPHAQKFSGQAGLTVWEGQQVTHWQLLITVNEQIPSDVFIIIWTGFIKDLQK